MIKLSFCIFILFFRYSLFDYNHQPKKYIVLKNCKMLD